MEKSVTGIVYNFILFGQMSIKLKSLIPFTTNMQEAVGLVLESLFVFGNFYNDYIEDNAELSDEEREWLRTYRDEILMNWFGPVGISKVPPKALKDRLLEYHNIKQTYFNELMNTLQPEAANLIQERIAEFTKMQEMQAQVQAQAQQAATKAAGKPVDPNKLQIDQNDIVDNDKSVNTQETETKEKENNT